MDTTNPGDSRESTPSRELGKKLIGLSLGEDLPGGSMISPGAISPNRSPHRKGPFSSLTYNSSAQKVGIILSIIPYRNPTF